MVLFYSHFVHLDDTEGEAGCLNLKQRAESGCRVLRHFHITCGHIIHSNMKILISTAFNSAAFYLSMH